MTTATPLNIIIVEKNGLLKQLSIKDFKENELFKKCGFKKAEDFQPHASWNLNFEGSVCQAIVYGKTNGRANNENKYEFPPPIDTKLFFGACCIVLKKKNNSSEFINLSLDKWNKIYEFLFNGFENLEDTNNEDEMDTDELENIPKSKKTKLGGYLKDNFVVDDDESCENDEDEMSVSSAPESEQIIDDSTNSIMDDTDDIQDITSELSEEQYLSDN